MPRSGEASDEPCRSLAESERKWIELLQITSDGNVPASDLNQIVELRELQAIESQMAL